jgi:plasmid stabilization system protein ParE
MISTHGNLVSFQLFTGPDYVFWFANFKLEEALSWPFRTRYGEEDMEDIAMKYAAHAVSQTVTFGDLWETKIRAKLANLEEGVFQHWHSGRIVLVGDSVHKVIPRHGLCCHCKPAYSTVGISLMKYR